MLVSIYLIILCLDPMPRIPEAKLSQAKISKPPNSCKKQQNSDLQPDIAFLVEDPKQNLHLPLA